MLVAPDLLITRMHAVCIYVHLKKPASLHITICCEKTKSQSMHIC